MLNSSCDSAVQVFQESCLVQWKSGGRDMGQWRCPNKWLITRKLSKANGSRQQLGWKLDSPSFKQSVRDGGVATVTILPPSLPADPDGEMRIYYR